MWREAMPLGNGRLGGMIWGRVQRERIDLNEDTLWSGEPGERINTNGLPNLPAIRALLLAGRNNEAQALVEQTMGGGLNASYLPLGQLALDFPFSGEISNYQRELDISQALARIQFTTGGATFTRQIFVSHPAQAVVVHLTCDHPGSISFNASLDSQLLHSAAIPAEDSTRDSAALLLQGRCPVHVDPNFAGKRISYDDAPDGKGERFEIRLAAVHQGGSVLATTNSLRAENCDSVTLFLVAATSFNGPWKSPSREGLDPAKLCDASLTPLLGQSFDNLCTAHIADFQSLFNRVRFDVGKGADNTLLAATRKPEGPASSPTDVRLAHYELGKDPALAALYYQMARYLLISCSRPGNQPANLQGLWNFQMQPAWSCNWTLNCNAEINYWGAEAANLPECHLPLIALTEDLSQSGARVARQLYGSRGWVSHLATSIWRQAGPGSGSACWSMFPVSSAWLSQHLWEHYAFSGDRAYLRQVWPVIRGSAEFYLDSLVEEPSHHWLVTAPDNNFENPWCKPNGETGCTCMGATASIQMVREPLQELLASHASSRRQGGLSCRRDSRSPRRLPYPSSVCSF